MKINDDGDDDEAKDETKGTNPFGMLDEPLNFNRTGCFFSWKESYLKMKRLIAMLIFIDHDSSMNFSQIYVLLFIDDAEKKKKKKINNCRACIRQRNIFFDPIADISDFYPRGQA